MCPARTLDSAKKTRTPQWRKILKANWFHCFWRSMVFHNECTSMRNRPTPRAFVQEMRMLDIRGLYLVGLVWLYPVGSFETFLATRIRRILSYQALILNGTPMSNLEQVERSGAQLYTMRALLCISLGPKERCWCLL